MQNGDKQENKKEYLTKIINSSSNKEEYLKQVQPIDFLKETTGKKVLYKYCSVSDASGEPKKYVVGAIENQTLSCSDPSVFNDPFDCKLGITFRQIYEYKFRTELDFIGSLSDEIKAVIDKKMSIKKMSGTALKAYL